MVKSCCVFGCHNRANAKNKGLPFYRLPRDPKILKKWLKLMRTETVRINSNTRVCGAHFPGGRRSSSTDLPSIFPWQRRPEERKTITSSCKEAPCAGGENQSSSVAEADEQEHVVSGVVDPESEDSERESTSEAPHVPSAAGHLPVEWSEESAQSNAEQLAFFSQEMERLKMKAAECDSLREECSSLRKDVASLRENFEIAKEAKLSEELSNAFLREEIQLLRSQLVAPVRFSINNIKTDDSLVRFYTGLPSYSHFLALSQFLSDCSNGMALWAGNARTNVPGRRTDVAQRTLSRSDELFLTLIKLRRDCPFADLGMRFGLSMSSVGRIFTTWLMLMFRKFKESAKLPAWPSREQVKITMPQPFKDLFPSTRVIIDCTEFPVEVPSDPDAQRVTWSTYKNRNTLKALVGITPSGAISFLSSLYGGSVSDREITSSCGILPLLQEGDSVMADKGFTISDLCAQQGAQLNIPPFVSSDKQLSADELVKTRRIASLRIHVERAMERIKNFHILDMIPASLFDIAEQLFLVCSIISQFDARLVS